MLPVKSYPGHWIDSSYTGLQMLPMAPLRSDESSIAIIYNNQFYVMGYRRYAQEVEQLKNRFEFTPSACRMRLLDFCVFVR